ncbi:MAG: transcription termination/antitermination protein NusG [Candidatus Promineifilaceae bacterium]
MGVKQWYALHTKPRAERKVAHLIAAQELEIYLPEAPAVPSSRAAAVLPFFPGYMFIRLNLEQDDSARWRWTPGLRYLVGYGDEPTPIPDNVIGLVAAEVARWAAGSRVPLYDFQPGDLVRVREGPFADLIAIFEGPSTPSERVQVLLNSMQRAYRLRLDAANLEKMPAGPPPGPAGRRPRRTRGRGRRIS